MRFTQESKSKCVQLRIRSLVFWKCRCYGKDRNYFFFLLCQKGLFSLLRCLFSVKLAVKYKIYYSNI